MKLSFYFSFVQDFLLLIPAFKWSPNIISPAFYCNRRLSRCIDGEFPSTENIQHLEAKKALGMRTSTPPEGQPTSISVLMTSRRQVCYRVAVVKINIQYSNPVSTIF